MAIPRVGLLTDFGGPPMTSTTIPAARADSGAPPGRRRHVSHTWAIVGFTTPFLALFALFYVLPIGYALGESFTKLERPSAFAPATTVFGGLEQYSRVFHDAAFWDSLSRVLVLVVTLIPVAIVLGLVFALLIDSPVVKGRKFFRLAFFAPYAVPGVVAAIMWGFFYAPTLSPLPDLANALKPLEPGAIMFALANIIVWSNAGFNMLIMYSALQSIPQELYEAARIDGAGQLRTAWSIKVPLVMPSIIMTAVLSLIGTLQLFNEPTVLRKLTEAVGSDFTPNMLVFATSAVPNYSLAGAFSVVLALSTCVLSFIFLRVTQKRAFA